MDYRSNPQLDLAFDYVSSTDKNIFLTGKAGTGKTTFLNRLKTEPNKRMAVVAPTGVAAINAGGMTIHSLFQLPFGLFLPEYAKDVARQRRFSREKIQLIQSLDLLVIDEISMVRADLLDAIDDVLRRYKDYRKPFGGVQLLMIGDLHQLPPVVKEDEWEVLHAHYETPYFFSSRALRETDPVTIELTHIFRQSDEDFIALLNRVRDNRLDAEVLDTLNSRYDPHFQPSTEDGYITLSTHNASAQAINTEKLASIKGKLHSFKAAIKGDFPEHAYPTDEVLELKVGAQVMFVKNDMGRERRYYNGKIGKVLKIGDEDIQVQCPGDDFVISVSAVEWTNQKYTLNEESKEIKEEIVGSFTQFPLKLAWAITIHKSQGLTFERAIIDAQAAFAHGQVYVALSRCKSFEGIVLRTKIAPTSVKTDSKVKNYTAAAVENAPDEAHLERSKATYQQSLLWELFDFRTLKQHFDQMNRVFLEHEGSLPGGGFQQFKTLAVAAETQLFATAQKFGPQLRNYFERLPGLPETSEELQERLQKAGVWFAEKLNAELLPAARNIQILSDNKTVKKTALEKLENLQKELFVKTACFAALKNGFSARAYTRAKADAAIDFKAAPVPSALSAAYSAIPKNAPHPELYASLKKWREDTADMLGVEQYGVLPTAALLQLVELLPGDARALKKVKGIGDGKVKQFGPAILDIIHAYCAAKGLEGAQLSLGVAEAPKPKSDTKTLSFELFKTGKSIDEIAQERGFVRSTIEGHLAHFVGTGDLDITEVMDAQKVADIARFFEEDKTRSTTDAKAHFGDACSYGEIRMVLLSTSLP